MIKKIIELKRADVINPSSGVVYRLFIYSKIDGAIEAPPVDGNLIVWSFESSAVSSKIFANMLVLVFDNKKR